MKKIIFTAITIFLFCGATSFAQWSTIGNSYVCASGVNQLVRFNNSIYASGVPQITGWNYANWQNFANVITPEKIWCVTVYQNEIYVCGEFSAIGAIAANNIARYNGITWSTVGAGLTGCVTNVAVYNGELYAFGYMGNYIFNNAPMAKWNGTSWSPLPGSNYFNGYVNDHIVFQNELVVAGSFSSIGGAVAYNLAKFNGTTWSGIGGGTNYIATILASQNNELYAGGYFSMVGGSIPASCIAKWDGSSWSSLGNGLGGTDHSGGTPAVHALAFYNNHLYAGGHFTSVGTGTGSDLALWDGNDWYNVGTYGGGTCGGVYALGVFDNDLWVAGLFDTAGTIAANNIARLTILTGTGENLSVNPGMSVFPNPASEKLYVTGGTIVGDQPKIKIYNVNGTLETEMAPNPLHSKTEIDISCLESGIYFLKAESSAGILTRKFVVRND